MRPGERVEKKSTKTHYKIIEINSKGKIILQRLVNGSKSDSTLIVDDLNSFKVVKPIENTVLFFDDEYDFLSNLFEEEVIHNGIKYPSAEHAFQAMKTSDVNEQSKIIEASSPSKAKLLGRKLTIKDNWEKIQEKEMYEVCLSKFKNNENLKKKLLDTGNLTLVNGNSGGDNYWGMYIDKDIMDGDNKLGRILMQVREELKNS
jgi:ribA/ribD-fused uncharacterized protein